MTHSTSGQEGIAVRLRWEKLRSRRSSCIRLRKLVTRISFLVNQPTAATAAPQLHARQCPPRQRLRSSRHLVQLRAMNYVTSTSTDTVQAQWRTSFSRCRSSALLRYRSSPYRTAPLLISHGPIAVLVSDLDALLGGVFWTLPN
jgi:hypothetical protein